MAKCKLESWAPLYASLLGALQCTMKSIACDTDVMTHVIHIFAKNMINFFLHFINVLGVI